MTVQFPPIRGTVAEQMADYRERIAERIKLELGRRGEQPRDLAYRLDVSTRTVERWLAGERKPQGRHLKAVSDDLGVPMEELNPDLESEEQAIRDWMDAIEDKLDRILEAMGLPLTRPEEAAQAAEAAAQENQRRRGTSVGTPAARRKKREAGPSAH